MAPNANRSKPFIQLTGEDGNGFFIISRARSILERSKDYSDAEIQEFWDEATSGDYDHLLQTVMKWFEVG